MDELYIPGETSNWQETDLWKHLEQSKDVEATSVKITLNECMPQIQKVLAQGQTSASDFTLHDSGHAFRVAHRMIAITPSDVIPKLSAYELALLLLSAYLHDIGMTPERRKVTLHHRYLLTGKPQDLSQSETDEFQKWLDDEGQDIIPPLSLERSTLENLQLADEMITYYCRSRHNDWSEEWIRSHLVSYQLATYVDWLDDLVALCRSHHYGYRELIKDRFDPKVVGRPARIVHLRYLACILRIADVLEFDPERTPEVILRHRDISPGSLIFWWKDHHISMIQDRNRLVLSARPPRAYIHRAIEVTADQIDEELQLCRTLADETHFEKCPGLAEDLPHRWDLVSSVYRNISAKDEAYEYINGAFRPNTQKLLELLSGVELYSTQLAAVRELLQNAFDAVREQMAYERLAKSNSEAAELEEILSKLHQVELRLETSTDGLWLICVDTGVGMTKAILRDHFLVSGAARRHDILDLERRCKNAGYSLGRTGQFGIGVLSYFMLANRVTIKSRRGQETGDPEPNGWVFETDGVGSFGELRRDATLSRGTEVRLHIRPEIIKDSPTIWFEKLRIYLKEMLVRIPCKFQLKSALPECESLVLKYGWANNDNDLRELVTTIGRPRQQEKVPDELVSNALRQSRQAEERGWARITIDVKQCLRWKLLADSLPNDLGRFRIHLPYFELPDGDSLVFLRVNKSRSKMLLNKIGYYDGYCPTPQTLMAWKGMKVSYAGGSNQHRLNAIVELDWNSSSAGNVSVNRGIFKPSKEGEKALAWLQQQISEMRRDFLRENGDSVYGVLNCRFVGSELRLNRKLSWGSREIGLGRRTIRWRALRFPAVNLDSLEDFESQDSFEWKGKRVYVVPSLHLDRSEYGGANTLNWHSSHSAPDRVVAFDSILGTKPCPLWTQKPKERPSHSVVLTCRFPPTWTNLIGVRLQNYSEDYGSIALWNAHHPIVQAIDSTGWEWTQSSFARSLDPLPLKGDLLRFRSRCASWVISCFEQEAADMWEGLNDRDPKFLKELWTVLFSARSGPNLRNPIPVCEWSEHRYDPKLNVLNPDGWSRYRQLSQGYNKYLHMYLPDPGLEWRLRPAVSKPGPVVTTNTKRPRKRRS